MTEPEVANVVGMITYQQELDLAALAETYTYVAFYRSGRCSIAGCESVEHFETVVEQVNSVMRDLLEFEYGPSVEVSNIVATADLGSDVSLETLSLELGMEQTEYEPEQFPALMYRDTGYVLLVFSSGKLLCTELTDLQAVSEALENMASRIRPVV